MLLDLLFNLPPANAAAEPLSRSAGTADQSPLQGFSNLLKDFEKSMQPVDIEENKYQETVEIRLQIDSAEDSLDATTVALSASLAPDLITQLPTQVVTLGTLPPATQLIGDSQLPEPGTASMSVEKTPMSVEKTLMSVKRTPMAVATAPVTTLMDPQSGSSLPSQGRPLPPVSTETSQRSSSVAASPNGLATSLAAATAGASSPQPVNPAPTATVAVTDQAQVATAVVSAVPAAAPAGQSALMSQAVATDKPFASEKVSAVDTPTVTNRVPASAQALPTAQTSGNHLVSTATASAGSVNPDMLKAAVTTAVATGAANAGVPQADQQVVSQSMSAMRGLLPQAAAFEDPGLSAARNAALTEVRAQTALPAPLPATPEARVLPAAPAPAVALQQREWQENSSSRKSDTAGIATGMSLTTESARSESAGLRPDAPTNSAQLSGEVARQIFQAHNRNLSQLRMQLNPEELGQLDLRLRVDGDRVHVAIVAQNAVARDLLESQLPQLRALLQEGGFELGDVDVRHQGGGGRDGYPADSQPGQAATTGQLAVDTAAGAEAAVKPAADSQDRLIDAFA